MPFEELCIFFEDRAKEIEEAGFEIVSGLHGNEGQTVYPVTIGPGVPALAVYLIKKHARQPSI